MRIKTTLAFAAAFALVGTTPVAAMAEETPEASEPTATVEVFVKSDKAEAETVKETPKEISKEEALREDKTKVIENEPGTPVVVKSNKSDDTETEKSESRDSNSQGPTDPTNPVEPTLTRVPLPKLVADIKKCGPSNDTAKVDPAWLEEYGHLVEGVWIDQTYYPGNPNQIRASSNIKSKLRGTYVWESWNEKSGDWTSWRAYPPSITYTDLDVPCEVTPEEPTDPVDPIPTKPETPALVYSEWIVTKPATCDEEGEQTRTVTASEYIWNDETEEWELLIITTDTETNTIPKLEGEQCDTEQPTDPEQPTDSEEPTPEDPVKEEPTPEDPKVDIPVNTVVNTPVLTSNPKSTSEVKDTSPTRPSHTLSELPYTGAPVGGLAAFGASLLAAAGALTVAGHRRKKD